MSDVLEHSPQPEADSGDHDAKIENQYQNLLHQARAEVAAGRATPPAPDRNAVMAQEDQDDASEREEAVKAAREMLETTPSKVYLGTAEDILGTFTEGSVPEQMTKSEATAAEAKNSSENLLRRQAGLKLVETYGKVGELAKARDLADELEGQFDLATKIKAIASLSEATGFNSYLDQARKMAADMPTEAPSHERAAAWAAVASTERESKDDTARGHAEADEAQARAAATALNSISAGGSSPDAATLAAAIDEETQLNRYRIRADSDQTDNFGRPVAVLHTVDLQTFDERTGMRWQDLRSWRLDQNSTSKLNDYNTYKESFNFGPGEVPTGFREAAADTGRAAKNNRERLSLVDKLADKAVDAAPGALHA
jgi:hypothetical protein